MKMTRDEAFLIVADDDKWSALNPRQKNELVVAHVFQQPDPLSPRHHHAPGHMDQVWCGHWFCEPNYETGDTCGWEAAAFSSGIAPAFDVIRHLQDKGLTFILTCTGDGNLQACTLVNVPAAPFPPKDIILHKNYFEDGITHQSESLPDAICRCALHWDLTKGVRRG